MVRCSLFEQRLASPAASRSVSSPSLGRDRGFSRHADVARSRNSEMTAETSALSASA
jgi:hypothetical protein